MSKKSKTTITALSAVIFVSFWIFIIGRNIKVASPSVTGSEKPVKWISPETIHFEKPKRILLWTTYYGHQPSVWGNNFYRITSRNCPVYYCEFVYDQRLVETADAVVFHSTDLAYSYKFPAHRSPNQMWIFFSMEPVPMIILDHSRNISILSGIFNWTMTYRNDSDIRVPFGKLVQHHPLPSKKNALRHRDFWSDKNKNLMVIWSVNVCFTFGNREGYVRDLKRYIKVDQYGTCNERNCGLKQMPERNRLYDEEDELCNRIISKYMFYLAFEESLCSDYVTDKIYVAMEYGAVPVVLGVANYTEYVPSDSFIDAFQFETVQDLANYLLKVAADKTLYNSYFAWKSEFKVDLGHPYNMHACDLCKKLYDMDKNKTTNTTTVIEEFGSWLSPRKLCYEYVPPEARLKHDKHVQPLSLNSEEK